MLIEQTDVTTTLDLPLRRDVLAESTKSIRVLGSGGMGMVVRPAHAARRDGRHQVPLAGFRPADRVPFRARGSSCREAQRDHVVRSSTRYLENGRPTW